MVKSISHTYTVYDQHTTGMLYSAQFKDPLWSGNPTFSSEQAAIDFISNYGMKSYQKHDINYVIVES